MSRTSIIPEQKLYIEQMRIAIPFLRQIPNAIYFRLDTTELYLPSGKVNKVRMELEKTLGQYVMTYKRAVFNVDVPPGRHLCANIKGALLTDDGLRLLKTQEMEVRGSGVSLVVYQNPLEFIDPAASALATFY